MIDTQAMRNKILDLAMRGQLTEQLTEDGTADELYELMQVEKDALIKAGTIKRKKPMPGILPDEVPYDIPNNWKWIRLADACSIINGDRGKNYPAKSTLKHDGIPFISALNLNGTGVTDDENLLCVDEHQYELLGSGKLQKDDIVICIRGSLGKHGRYPFEQGAIASSLVISRLFYPSRVLGDFEMAWLDSPMFPSELQKYDNGTAQPNLAANNLEKFLFPLPPLTEQQRIVDKINQTFSILDTIDTLQAQYADNLTALKAKLIDAAIQGKLTEQLPEDGTAEELYQQIQAEKQALIKAGKIKKEKPLPEISDDEIPFEIPGNWKWVRLSSVIDVRDGTHDTPKYYDHGIPLITSKNLSSGKLDFNDVKLISCEDAKKINERSHVERGDILFAMIGTIGNPVIVDTDREFCIKNVALFKRFHGTQFNMEYLLFYLLKEQNELKKISLGGLQPFVSLKLFRAHPFPLPPLDEQNRIVVVLKNILLMCEG